MKIINNTYTVVMFRDMEDEYMQKRVNEKC